MRGTVNHDGSQWVTELIYQEWLKINVYIVCKVNEEHGKAIKATESQWWNGGTHMRRIDLRDIAILKDLYDGNHLDKINGLAISGIKLDRTYDAISALYLQRVLCQFFRTRSE